jgi:hypothetical protein
MALLAQNSAASESAPDPCFHDAVVHHVREQLAIYGPRSDRHEYFGFVYLLDGRIAGTVTSGWECRGGGCTVNPLFALRRIPRGAKVLAEWHTHPRIGMHELSPEDVRGANANRRIRCYSAFYSSPDGTIWRWNPAQASVSDAMASRMAVGNIREREILLAQR